MEKKLTAVESLVQCITDLEFKLIMEEIDSEEYGKRYRKYVDEAKKIELDDLTDAYEDGYDNGYKTSGKSGYEYLLDNFINTKN